MGFIGSSTVNAGSEFFYSLYDGKTREEALKESSVSWFTSLGGGALGKGFEIPLDKKFNPTWKFYTEKSGHLPYGISEPFKPSYVQSVTGNAVENLASPFIKERLDKRINGVEDDKK